MFMATGFFLISLISLFILIPFSLIAWARLGNDKPLNKLQLNLLRSYDKGVKNLGKAYWPIYGAGFGFLTFWGFSIGAYLSSICFIVLIVLSPRLYLKAKLSPQADQIFNNKATPVLPPEMPKAG